MRTNQIMQRDVKLDIGNLYNSLTVRQRTKDSYFNATDLISIYNKITGKSKMTKDFLRLEETNQFIQVIEIQEVIKQGESSLKTDNQAVSLSRKAVQSVRGKDGGVWMHPYLFIDFAMWISPEFKYHTIKWVYDNLIKFRVESGDEYVNMNKALQKRYFSEFGVNPPQKLFIVEAKRIKESLGVSDWSTASELQLEYRKKLEESNTLAFGSEYNYKQRLFIFNHLVKEFNSKLRVITD